jgi:molecular chaperone GrpE
MEQNETEIPQEETILPDDAADAEMLDVDGRVVDEEPGAEAEGDDPIVRLVQEFKEAVKARDEWEDRYLRAAAEFSNARRRAEMRADSEARAVRERVLSGILPVVDDFERAFQAVPEDEQGSSWVEGFALIQRKLQGMLAREGVTTIDAAGEMFDPGLHQAVLVEAVEDAAPGVVLEVLQQGYMLDGRVLRPAMVKVAQ